MVESASNDQKAAFEHLLDALPAGAYTCDSAGLITYFNRQAVEVWGREPKLHDSADRFCGSFKLFATDGSPIAHDQCWMAMALKEGKEFNDQEIVIERPDGKRITALAHASPFKDAAGRVTGAVNVLINISDHRRAADAESLLAAIVKSCDDAIYSRDLSGRILSWNTAAQDMFGYAPEEAIGRSIELIIPEDKREHDEEVVKRICFYERVEHFETVRVAKDGRRIDVSVTISPIRDVSGRIVGVSKIARDIAAQSAKIAAKMNTWPRLRTSCAIRWRPSAMRCTFCI